MDRRSGVEHHSYGALSETILRVLQVVMKGVIRLLVDLVRLVHVEVLEVFSPLKPTSSILKSLKLAARP